MWNYFRIAHRTRSLTDEMLTVKIKKFYYDYKRGGELTKIKNKHLYGKIILLDKINMCKW